MKKKTLTGRISGFFRRAPQGEEEPPSEPAPNDEPLPPATEGVNLLLISDLHLGEACKDHSRIEYLKRSATLDEDLCRFLEHHTHNRLDGRPWRLVLAGDLLDFLQVTIVPTGASDEARRFGLGTTEEESAWKLSRLMERHRRAFVYLAGFVGAGHQLDIIQGNHDEELFWPKVQETLVAGLKQIYFGGEDTAEVTPEDFESRVRFHPWCLHIPGVLYVEHGHRYDPYCATPPQLCPLRPGDERELTQPLSGLAIRYFANLERGFQTHDKEHWGLREYSAYYRSRGWGHLIDVWHRYVHFLKQAHQYYRDHGSLSSEAAHAQHQAALVEVAEAEQITLADLQALDTLGAPSVTSDAFGLYAGVGMAEWTAISGALFVALLMLLTPWSWWVELGLIGAGIFAGVRWVRYARGRFPLAAPIYLSDAAEQIGARLKVPVVAMGHTHKPLRRRQAFDHRAFYVNTGSFLAPHGPHHGPTEPCTCRTTFVVIPHAGAHDRPSPKLYRWCVVNQKPAPFKVKRG
ncbi:MAG: hypothetical protein ACE366_06070 [Bradymonadia bacterium]